MFAALQHAAQSHQVLVLTCRERAFESLGGNRIALRTWEDARAAAYSRNLRKRKPRARKASPGRFHRSACPNSAEAAGAVQRRDVRLRASAVGSSERRDLPSKKAPCSMASA